MTKYSSHKALTEGVTQVSVTPAGPSYFINSSCDEDCSDEYLLSGQLFDSFEDCKEDCLRILADTLQRYESMCKNLKEQQRKLQNQNES